MTTLIAGIRAAAAVPFFMGATRRLEGRRRPLFNLLDRDSYAREAATNLALARFERDEVAQVAVQAEETEEGRLLVFFQWVLDHKEEIIALIKLIIDLFATAPVPVGNASLLGVAVGDTGLPLYDLASVSSVELSQEVQRRMLLGTS